MERYLDPYLREIDDLMFERRISVMQITLEGSNSAQEEQIISSKRSSLLALSLEDQDPIHLKEAFCTLRLSGHLH